LFSPVGQGRAVRADAVSQGADGKLGSGANKGAGVGADQPRPEPEKVSEQLERWLRTSGDKTLGSLNDLFQEKSFAILFVLLLGVPALPLPTGGVTHVFEIIAALAALELIAGRDQIWVPQRWRKLELAGPKRRRFITGLMKMI